MSLGYALEDSEGDLGTINGATQAAINAGIMVTVAAGNEYHSASLSYPANLPDACTVGATNISDFRADYSNWGAFIDVFAPGEELSSTYLNNGYHKMGGTSMASPVVAGLAAYLLSTEGPRKPVDLCKRIQELATKSVVKDSKSTNNMLVFNGNYK